MTSAGRARIDLMRRISFLLAPLWRRGKDCREHHELTISRATTGTCCSTRMEIHGESTGEPRSSDARLTAVEWQDRLSEGGRSKRLRSRHSWSGRAVWQQPRQRLGHRLDQACVLLAGEVVSGEQAECCAERRAFGLVSQLTVLRFPAHQRDRALREAEEPTAELLPTRTEVVLLDLRKGHALRRVVCVEAPTFMPVPTPRGALDTIRIEHAKIGGEAIEFVLTGTLASHR